MIQYDSQKPYTKMPKHRLQIYTYRFKGFGFSFLTRVNNPQIMYGDYFLFEIIFLWLNIKYTYHYQLPKENK